MECDYLEHRGMAERMQIYGKWGFVSSAIYGTVPLRGGLAAAASFGLLNKNYVTIGS